jgi:hypothetical protein
MSKATVAAPARVDVIFIRKSSHGQDDKAQADTVRAMLRGAGVYVQEWYWFRCTVPRARVQGNAEFRRLMELVEARNVGTVYAESLDRLGDRRHRRTLRADRHARGPRYAAARPPRPDGLHRG